MGINRQSSKPRSKNSFLVTLMLVSFLAACCQNTKKMKEKHDWSGSLCAPEEYPVEVFQGSLIAKDYEQGFKNWGIVNSGWGHVFGTVASGPPVKNIPDSLQITWLSFQEKKFWSGKFALPKEKIRSLFEQGFTDYTGRRMDFHQILVGMAPLGSVSVWVTGAGKQVEVGRFRAEEIQIDASKVASDEAYMFRPGYTDRTLQNDMIITSEIKQKIETKGLPDPSDYFGKYTRKFSWKPVFELGVGSSIERFGFWMWNGEADVLFKESLSVATPNALPVNCYFYWTDAAGERHGVKVKAFDENEIFAAFGEEGNDVELVFRASGKDVQISVRKGQKEVTLEKVAVQSF